MEKLLWKTLHKCNFNKEADFLESILLEAGVEDIYSFLNVNKTHTHDPFLFRNMKEGVELLHTALENIKENHKSIFIKRDPDVDGFTSSAYMKGFLLDIAPDVNTICKGSYTKEHGIFLDDIKKEAGGIELIIVPDAGSESVEECKMITEKYNIPILILDHHEYNADVMKYATLINCQDGVYPNNTLSGVGVVHKFCLAYAKTYGINEKVCDYYIDLVSLGLIADSMDMRNLETRYYALEGLKEENRHNLLIKEIALKCAEEMKLGFTLDSIGWVIAPKLNGTIRYGKDKEQDDLFRALCGEEEMVEYQPRRKHKDDPKPPVEYHTLQRTMARVCINVKARQDKDVRTFMTELNKKIKAKGLDNNSVIIVDATDILTKKTVTGLVANKLASEYHRPVVILKKRDEETYGGSGRGYDKGGIEDFNQFLSDTKLFECAGHPSAFGVTITKDNVMEAIKRCNEKLKLEDLVTIHTVDYELNAGDLTNTSVMEVAESYQIWGKGVPEPTFAITNIIIPAKDIIGCGDNNIFIKFKYNNVDYIKKYCKGTDFSEMTLRDRSVLGENKKILNLTVIGNFTLNEWEGKKFPQVKINYFYAEEYKGIEDEVSKEATKKEAEKKAIKESNSIDIDYNECEKVIVTPKKAPVIDGVEDDFLF